MKNAIAHQESLDEVVPPAGRPADTAARDDAAERLPQPASACAGPERTVVRELHRMFALLAIR